VRISVIQMSPGSDKDQNLGQAERLVEACVASEKPDLIVLPEVWTCLGGNRDTKFAAAEELPFKGSGAPGGPAYEFLRALARRHNLLVHGGSIGERRGDRLANTTLVFAPDGTEAARYSKIHLFDITTPTGASYRESDTYCAGEEVVTFPAGPRFGDLRIGLAICYDIRFGELFHRLRQQGAELILLPAAFTAETGEAHWETLIRARAIETQCWFAAAGTTGLHRDASGQARATYGHSLVVDAWGTVVAQASSGESWATARLDQQLTRRVREGIPVMQHRRLM